MNSTSATNIVMSKTIAICFYTTFVLCRTLYFQIRNSDDTQNLRKYTVRMAGQESGHRIWFIFQPISSFEYSYVPLYYAIKNMEEAKAYLQHEILGNRLKDISRVLLMQDTDNATLIFGSPDDLKLHSSMTLFSFADEETTDNVFEKVLAKYFKGKYDRRTEEVLENE